MGRKQNRTAIWNSFKKNKKLIRTKGGHANNNSNVFMIDPEQQKKQKLARKLAEQLKPKQASKKQLNKLQKLREKKAKENALKTALFDLEKHQLTNNELALMVATKHKETKKERLKRLYLTKKAGIDIDDSELYIVKSTPSQIMHLKKNSLKKYNTDTINYQNENEIQSATNNKFEFGNLSTNELNSLIPGAKDKQYKLKDGIKVISTRKNVSRKRKKQEIILMDISSEKSPNKISSDSDNNNTNNDNEINNYNIKEPVRKKHKKRKSFGGLKSKSMRELQAFLECDSDDDTLMINSMNRKRKLTVQINRLAHIIEARMQLPIIGEEYTIMECINTHDVVLICGETGSGKSTQVPQFLYEAGYSFNANMPGMIGVTEPRRVAAISVCKRVGIELNMASHVSYQIRYDSQITPDTHIKFMTDGILLREIQFDFLLHKYGVIILDEAHERNLNTDVLIGLLSRIVKQRRILYNKSVNDGNNKNNICTITPLKLIIMSATLKVSDFSENLNLFTPSPPLIKIPSRQYPVTIHFNKTTPMSDEEYEEEVFEKICKIHILLPKGHILVFLTGRRQIEFMCKRLRERFKNPTKKTLPVYDHNKDKKLQHYDKNKEICVEDTIMNEHDNDDEDDNNVYLDKDWQYKAYSAVNILPLYSLLSTERQSLVFNKQAINTRLIVLATNIAETSITISNIGYVVDCGRVKQEKYSAHENMSKMVIEFISKSSAEQRAGRSGRTGPGHCYRLYSANFFDKWMVNHFEPEILRVPIENILLIMKAMNIKSILNFPFPTPPKQENIFSGLRILETLGALNYNNDGFGSFGCGGNNSLMLLRNNECLKSDEYKLCISELGTSLIEYPINVRLAKMLILGYQGQCLPFVIAICCLLSVESLQFLPDEIDKILNKKLNANNNNNNEFKNVKEKEKWQRKYKREIVINARYKFANNKSDILSYLNIFGAYKCYKNWREKQMFCRQHFIRFKNISECNSLMIQIQKIIYNIYQDKLNNFELRLPLSPPSNIQEILLRQIIASGLMDQIARKWPNESIPNDEDWIRSKRNYLILKKAYQCMSAPNKPVFIHPSSYIFSSKSFIINPQFVVYFSLHKSETVSMEKNKNEKRIYMHHVTVIESHWLLNIAPHLCIISEPLNDKPFYDEINDEIKCYVNVRFGPFQWQLPKQSIKYPNEKIYYWFARLLLEGKIFSDLKCITPYLQYRPNIITDNKYAIVSNKAVIALIEKLKQYKIDSKHKLKLSLTKNQNFLFKEIKMFVYNIKQYVLKKVWPPKN